MTPIKSKDSPYRHDGQDQCDSGSSRRVLGSARAGPQPSSGLGVVMILIPVVSIFLKNGFHFIGASCELRNAVGAPVVVTGAPLGLLWWGGQAPLGTTSA